MSTAFLLRSAKPVPVPICGERTRWNLFYTRLDGHGRAFDAMGDITIKNWVNDMAEALAVGHAIGEKVVVVSTSTRRFAGQLGARPTRLASQIDAAVFISPNYGVKADGAFLLTMPFAKELAHMIVGPRRSFVPATEKHKEFWTYDYPTDALLPMAEMVKLANTQPFESFKVPALFFISDSDQVVQPDSLAPSSSAGADRQSLRKSPRWTIPTGTFWRGTRSRPERPKALRPRSSNGSRQRC